MPASSSCVMRPSSCLQSMIDGTCFGKGITMNDRYAQFTSLRFESPAPHVLRIIMSNPGRLNAAHAAMHRDLAAVWTEIDRDPETYVAIIQGEGDAFSAGGDLDLVQQMAADHATRVRVLREARDLVYNVINCS